LILELVFSHNVDNSDGEWDEPSPQEYDIFGDAQPPDASTDQEPAHATVQEAPNACTAEQPSSSDPASASPIESHAQTEATKEPVELLSQQDIEDFLEIENEESCRLLRYLAQLIDCRRI